MKNKYLFNVDKNPGFISWCSPYHVDLMFCVYNSSVDYIGEDCKDSINIFEEVLENTKCDSIALYGFRDEHIEYILPLIGNIKRLYIKCRNVSNYNFFEKLEQLEEVIIFDNIRSTKIWDTFKNKRLKTLSIINSNKLTDFDGLRNSNIEKLALHGCNYCSSFVPKLVIGDLSFLFVMPKLKDLELNIKKTESDEYYINVFSELGFLDKIYLNPNFFTFNDFARLAKKLPNTKGIEPYYYIGEDEYCVIGKNSPKNITLQHAKVWEEKFNNIKK